jgi:hypothetical protein
MLLGWIAGSMVVTDPALLPYLAQAVDGAKPVVGAWTSYGAGVFGALLVLAVGTVMKKRDQAPTP